jgi:hypothetical protein
MTGFRGLLVAMFGVITVYSGITISGSGWNLLPVFFGDIRAWGWPGQFNLDFMQMLALSAIWVAWRHRFSPAGVGLAALAFFGGSMFLSAYLLVASLGVRGGVSEILVGPSRTAMVGNGAV